MAPGKSKAPMILARWRARRANRILIDQIHGEIVAAARAPALFQDLTVPDDLDGRFEMVTLHSGLVLRRLSALGPIGAAISQDLVDYVFQSFEDALREMSIGDAGVANRMMVGPSSSLLGYSLRSSAGGTGNWGHTVGVDTVSGTGSGSAQTLSVLGQIPAGQSVQNGPYADTITVTVTY